MTVDGFPQGGLAGHLQQRSGELIQDGGAHGGRSGSEAQGLPQVSRGGIRMDQGMAPAKASVAHAQIVMQGVVMGLPLDGLFQ